MAAIPKLRRQIEFYFGDANFRKDKFLRGKAEAGGGWVDISVILAFRKVAELTQDINDVIAAIEDSEALQIDETKTKIKRKTALEEVDTSRERTVYVRGIPTCISHEDVAAAFGAFGRVELVSLPRHRETREFKGFGFVELSSAAEAEKAIAAMNGSWPEQWPTRRTNLTVTHYKEWEMNKKAMLANGAKISESNSSKANKTRARENGVDENCSEVTGCVVHISGIRPPVNLLAIRHFVEHTVTLRTLDYTCMSTEAWAVMHCYEDALRLLEDLRKTRLKLRCVCPTVRLLSASEEPSYWAKKRSYTRRHAWRSEEYDSLDFAEDGSRSAKRQRLRA